MLIYIGSQPILKCDAVLRVSGEAADGAILACESPLSSVVGLENAAASGVVAVVGPGGAARDWELIEVANQYGLTMISTHHRPFRRLQ